ncbi:uncharacterized protein [Drosophila virilis]|nr:proline-rich 33 kDa extensin-related protein [Drosophila virilis]
MFNSKTQAQNLGLMLLQLLLLLVAAVSMDAAALRPRRDVSHLPLEYLPPVVLPPLPSRDYLPPVEQHAASLPHVVTPPRDYLPPVESLQLSNEYLPPASLEQLSESTTEAAPATTTSTTELPTTEAAPTNPTTEQPAAVETESPVEPETHEEIVEPAGVLHADGYHYAAPDIIPDLTPTAAPVEAYLPPLDDNAVVAEELPESEESAALLDDGYHYRAIRRLRF